MKTSAKNSIKLDSEGRITELFWPGFSKTYLSLSIKLGLKNTDLG